MKTLGWIALTLAFYWLLGLIGITDSAIRIVISVLAGKLAVLEVKLKTYEN